MNKTILALALGAVTLTGAAQAQLGTKARELNQERRIDAGQRSGKLTRAEAARLDSEQRQIKRLEAQLKRRHGGHLTRADKRLIQMKQDQANRHILQQKHDAQRGRNKLPV